MNKKISIAALAIIVIALLVVVLKPSSQKDNSEPEILTPVVNKTVEKMDTPTTVAAQWQWSERQEQGNKDVNMKQTELDSDAELFPFTAQSVHDALSIVKIDANGDIILDNDALISLDEALERIYNKLDGESVLALEDLIRDALPGKAGEQTAKVVSDYNNFLRAKEQFSLLHENTEYNSSEQTIQTIKRDQNLYSELQSLREVHLGREVTQNLFREHDATAEFMFDSMALGLDDSLTPELIEQRRQAIESKYREIVPLELAPAEGQESSVNGDDQTQDSETSE